MEILLVFDKDGAFTREHLLNIKKCCKNGCKNCPYGYKKMPDIKFNEREQQAIKQYLQRLGVAEELRNIKTSEHTVGFRPGEGEIRLTPFEFSTFCDKVMTLVK